MALIRCCYNVLRIAKNRLENSRAITSHYPQIQSQVFRSVHSSFLLLKEHSESEHSEPDANETSEVVSNDPAINRDIKIPVETSIQYLDSSAFKQTYGNNPVWKEYRRNFKGQFPPYKTRKTCIRYGKISSGNPCPICRDEYLVLDYRNVKLLQQFICPHTGSILSFTKTGLCQVRHRELIIAIRKARDCGFLEYDVPYRVYDYSQYINI